MQVLIELVFSDSLVSAQRQVDAASRDNNGHYLALQHDSGAIFNISLNS